MKQAVFVTGANRGIGLAVSKALLDQGHTVWGACRKPAEAKALSALGASHTGLLHIVELEVASDSSAIACAKAVAEKTDHLDAVLNVAGILPQPHDEPLEKIDFQKVRDAYEVNVIGPLRVTRALLPLLRKGRNPRLVNITSGVGSLARTDNPHFLAYGPSKAALNKISRSLSFALKGDGITVVALDPGWVKTDMGGANAQLTPEESAGAIVATLGKLDPSWTGKYIYNDGSEIPW